VTDELKDILLKARHISALTGAGISVSAGIPDFRGEKGIYTTGVYGTEIFDIAYFFENPKPFYDFARAMYPMFEHAEPTKAHIGLSMLQNVSSVCIVTQNIDFLHEKASSKEVIHLHGDVSKAHCLKCGKSFSFNELKRLISQYDVPFCDVCGGLIKPDIVFFGEAVKGFDKATECIGKSDVFLALGTSLEVSPANMLVAYARGIKILVNKSRTPFDEEFDYVFYEDLDHFFEGIIKSLEEVRYE